MRLNHFIFLILGIFTLISSSYFVSASSYYLEFNQVGDKIVVRESINGASSSYTDSNLLEETKIGYFFLEKISFPADFEKATIKLNLDNGYVIGEDGAYPASYKVETDGQTISLVWSLENVKSSESLAVFVNIRNLQKGYSWIWFVIGFIILAVLIYFFTVFFVKKRKTKNLDKHLLDEERKLLEELSKAERHEMWQRNIQQKLNLSKAKTSRLIRNLESRELIEKISFGNTNKIVLK